MPTHRLTRLRRRPALRNALDNARRTDPAFPDRTHLAWMDAYGLALVSQQQWLAADAVYEQLGQYWAKRDDITTGELAELLATFANLRLKMAERLFDQGDYALAEPLWVKLSADGRQKLERGDGDGLYPILKLANTLLFQGREDEAESLLRDTLALSERTLGPDDPSSLVALFNLAETVFRRNRRDEALPLYQEAEAAAIRTLGPDSQLTLLIRRGLATNLAALNRNAEAEPILRAVLAAQTSQLGADNLYTLRTANDLALTLLGLGRGEEALALIDQVDGPLAAQLGDSHPEVVTLRQNRAAVLRLLNRDLDGSLAEARKALQALREQRSRFASTGREAAASRSLTPTERNVYGLLVETAYNARFLPGADIRALSEEGFMAAQEVMDSPASTALARRIARSLAAREGSEVLTRFEALEALSAQFRSLIGQRTAAIAGSADANPAAVAGIERELDALDGEIKARSEALARDFPAFAALADAPPLDLRKAKELVRGTDDAILIVLPTYLGTHVFGFSDRDFGWARSDLTDKGIDQIVRRLLWDLGASVDVGAEEERAWTAEGQGAFPFDRADAHKLYQELVAPVAAQLGNARHLYVVAGGSLASLPFSVLVTEPPQGEDGDPAALRATAWLADKYALVQLPSLQALDFQRRYAAHTAASSGFVGIGDPALDGGAQTRGTGARGGSGTAIRALQVAQAFKTASAGPLDAPVQVNQAALRQLARLPGTARELEQMRQVIGQTGSTVLTGERATEAAVKRTDLSGVAVIAFATHGLLAGELGDGAEPGLVLTPPERPDALDDGLLTTSEIADLSLNAQWVILSACNTAAGDGSSGAPGLSGLAKAFFYAGARSLLASHWPVRDDVAAQLTVTAIRLQRGNPSLSRAEALQGAMRAIRNDTAHDTATDTWAHPNAWAPFSLIGDASD